MSADDSMRSINSFGVAGLLAANCEVFYSNDLRGRNIGRVSDLISAKLRASDIDELRVRALLAYGVFQVYALRGMPNHHDEAVPPAAVEIGVDGKHVAVAVAMHWGHESAPNWKGLGERVDKGMGADPFEKSLEWIVRHSSQVLVRYEAKERRIEIVSILNRVKADLKDPTMVVAVDSKTAPLLEVSNYVEIGDLNYSKLLRNPVAETEAKVDGRSPQESLEEVNVKGSTDESESVRVIGGTKSAADASERRFSAGSGEADAAALREIREEYESTVSELKNTVQELKDRLEAAENAASERRFSGGDPVEDDTPIVVKGSPPEGEEKKDDWGFHFLKQVWPFAPKEGAEGEGESPAASAATVEPDAESREEIVEPLPEEPTPDEEKREPTEAERAASAALDELSKFAKEKKSKKLEATLHEIEEQAEPNKAKRWVENLSSELLQEKAKLNELQKNLTKQMRSRELEFKTAERALKQELKRKDEMISQRQSAIENKNDQIAQLNLAVERASANTSDKETQQIKVKLDRAQKLAQMKEEESKSLVTKVRDLENRLIIAQAKAQKGNDLQNAAKIQSLEKKVDEYKRINQRLMDSLNSQKDKTNDKEVGDLRRKIDQLDRLNTEAKRNLEKSAFKVRELQESERKLQSDLARAVEENRNLRKANSRGSGESGGGQAA
ncbi:MAG: hypothetical protein JST04_12635 [Bdellovibrionales bacterium]|nr:hypothetical protein [Bdellovibrionales bacterium]